MKDAVELLLQEKPGAEELLVFHCSNREFLPRVVAELRWLKALGRKAGGADAVVHYLRWDRKWRGVDHFEVNQNLAALAVRVCVLLWPDINGLLQFRKCPADRILGTSIRRRKGHYGAFLRVNKTMQAQLNHLPHAPDVPVVERESTIHRPITESEAAGLYPFFETLVAGCPNSSDPVLQAWLVHAKRQPEIFALMERTLLERRLPAFSARSLVEYVRWSVRRAAESHKRFTLASKFNGLYPRALILRNTEFNGLCKFREDGTKGRANRLLGTSLALERINNEPYLRLIWEGNLGGHDERQSAKESGIERHRAGR